MLPKAGRCHKSKLSCLRFRHVRASTLKSIMLLIIVSNSNARPRCKHIYVRVKQRNQVIHETIFTTSQKKNASPRPPMAHDYNHQMWNHRHDRWKTGVDKQTGKILLLYSGRDIPISFLLSHAYPNPSCKFHQIFKIYTSLHINMPAIRKNSHANKVPITVEEWLAITSLAHKRAKINKVCIKQSKSGI